MLKPTLWSEFFLDPNVRFPEYPKLIEGISIYDAPYGLGIQFRGGPKKLIIKGKFASEIFTDLKEKITGTFSLEQLLNDVGSRHDINEVATILKLLHAHNLLINAAISSPTNTSPYQFSKNQVAFFSRTIGRTGFQVKGEDAAQTILNSKILLIASDGLIPSLMYNLDLAGFPNIGLFYYSRIADAESNFQQFFPNPLLTNTNISKLDEQKILNILHTKAEDYQYIVVAFENPSQSFLISINEFCINRNIPAIFIVAFENSFQIGPFVVPKASACYTCSVLRMNSYNNDSVYDNIFQDNLTKLNIIVDKDIVGFDQISVNIATGILIGDLTKIVTGHSLPMLVNQVLLYDSIGGLFNQCPLIRVPGCSSCSN